MPAGGGFYRAVRLGFGGVRVVEILGAHALGHIVHVGGRGELECSMEPVSIAVHHRGRRKGNRGGRGWLTCGPHMEVTQMVVGGSYACRSRWAKRPGRPAGWAHRQR
jgi:hypothetical protein